MKEKKVWDRTRAGCWLLSCVMLGGCDRAVQVGSSISTMLMKEYKKWRMASSPVSSPTSQPTARASFVAKSALGNAELLHEIFVVVFMEEPKDRNDFENWLDSVNQGASFEGVYHGLVQSTEYKRLETTSPAASVETLQTFGAELARIEAELPVPTSFESSIPASKISADQYAKQFVTQSIFTLKRILGDEALKLVASKSGYKEKLALWYSRWAVQMAQRNIDFGISLRNLGDEPFHYKWAVENSEDLVRWEVLNRLHRILNESSAQKQ